MKIKIPPNLILIQWRNEELKKGNRAKAIRIQRLINKRKYYDYETGKYSEI